MFTINAFVSTDFHRSCDGYDPEVGQQFVGTYRVEGPSYMDALENFWAVGNRMALDADGRRWPRTVHSFSIGDMVIINDTMFTPDRIGWISPSSLADMESAG